jgi:N-acetylglucosamine malate deacetylase 1
MKTVLVVAPHPDDETLGCGGTLLRHISEGNLVHWLIVTMMTEEAGYLPEIIAQRSREIETVRRLYGFTSVSTLNLPTSHIDESPMSDVIDKIGRIFKQTKPSIVYVPYRGDVHTDHAFVFDAVTACSKWFRYDSVKRVLAYETLSETDFGMNLDAAGFRPTVFMNVTDFLEKKITIMRTYSGELGTFPFPRSEAAIRALATLRGAAAGCNAAEAFMLLKEIQ